MLGVSPELSTATLPRIQTTENLLKKFSTNNLRISRSGAKPSIKKAKTPGTLRDSLLDPEIGTSVGVGAVEEDSDDEIYATTEDIDLVGKNILALDNKLTKVNKEIQTLFKLMLDTK